MWDHFFPEIPLKFVFSQEMSLSQVGIFCIFDGHAGKAAAENVKRSKFLFFFFSI